MVYPLPKFVVISSNKQRNKYFGPSGPNGHVKGEVVDLHGTDNLKHEVVNSASHPGMIHLKCLDTGKYWSWGQNRVSQNYICAQQNRQVTDLSSNACTLIKYVSHTTDGVTSFQLEFRWNSEWHSIMKENGEYLISGKKTKQHYRFIMEDWHKADRATNNKKNTKTSGSGSGSGSGGGGGGGGGGGSVNNNISITFGKLSLDKK